MMAIEPFSCVPGSVGVQAMDKIGSRCPLRASGMAQPELRAVFSEQRTAVRGITHDGTVAVKKGWTHSGIGG